jgi:hypothetical protein
VEVGSSQDGVRELDDVRVGVCGVSTIAELKGSHLGGGIGSIVACEFGGRQEGIPVILTIVHKGTEHVFEGTVCSLSLAIGLGVVSSGHG